ncbi:hypothetical protein EYR40_010008 [Pleurotus pulmonarius]|nr:hypothetical protein EYR36_003077 [Pleurotus pulmonarius]KAF4566378.1 hypothetical protein EYR36_011804 [Pleurotus pulmonarius]KAF4568587.1 hypothetical protein EYR36_010599 [Pleurotus pulmonarius]KAF4576727.1 hypothetical protein EYR36_004706 [Pleurotus pulmonarius]KAF4578869.1 hypothetical protein EYR36_000677 [Pleurotus pulmonarius]
MSASSLCDVREPLTNKAAIFIYQFGHTFSHFISFFHTIITTTKTSNMRVLYAPRLSYSAALRAVVIINALEREEIEALDFLIVRRASFTSAGRLRATAEGFILIGGAQRRGITIRIRETRLGELRIELDTELVPIDELSHINNYMVIRGAAIAAAMLRRSLWGYGAV